MKFRITFFYFFIPLLVLGQNFNYALYDVKIDKKKFSKFLSDGKYKSFERRFYTKMFNEANSSQLTLFFDKENSIFKPLEKMEVGESNSNLAKGGLFFFLGFENLSYYDKKNELMYHKRGSGDFIHLVKSEPNNILWKLTRNEKKVKGLLYRKAYSKTIDRGVEYYIEAWYCPEIANQFGPDRFFGLPGLITEVYITEKDFSYSIILTKIKYDKKVKAKISLNDYKVFTQEESDSLFREIKKDK